MLKVLLFGLLSALIAHYKGFKPLRWIFSFSVLGVAVVLILPNAKEVGITREEAARRAEKGDRVGAFMSAIFLGLMAVTLVVVWLNR